MEDFKKIFLGFEIEPNIQFLDSIKLEKEVYEKYIKPIFNKYFIESEYMELGGKGGGPESLLDVIRKLWENREVFQIIFAVFIFGVKNIQIYFRQINYKQFASARPRITMILNIRDDKDLGWRSNIEGQLIGLKFLSDEISNELSKQLPIFCFDQYFSYMDTSKKYSVSFSLSAENRKQKSLERIVKIIKNLPLKPGLNVSYSFSKYSIAKVLFTETGKKNKKYNLFFNRPISHYFANRSRYTVGKI